MFPEFSEMHIFAQQKGPRTKSFGAIFTPPLFFFLLLWVWFDPNFLNLPGIKKLVKSGPESALLHPCHLFWQGSGTDPAPPSHP